MACFGHPGAKITGTYVSLESFGRLLERPNREGISAFAAGSPVRECRILGRGHRCKGAQFTKKKKSRWPTSQLASERLAIGENGSKWLIATFVEIAKRRRKASLKAQ